jgi:hypothetical protein
MKKKAHTLVLTRAARDAGVPLDRLSDAALVAAGECRDGNIWFHTFRVNGRQFALSTRMVVEVDHFPHRTPAVILASPAARVRRPNR